MGNRYLIISDLHLTDVEDHPDGWMYYKSSRFLFDKELSQLLKSFMARGDKGDNLILLLNGDIIDFDLITKVPEDSPWRLTRSERKCGLEPSAEKSVWKLNLVLSHHQGVVSALADFIAAGHKLVYLMGNHDREFHFPEVQQAFIQALDEQARNKGASLARGSISFEPWFYYVKNEVYVEHGHQYDLYTSFRYQLSPVVKQGNEEVLALPMGDLSNRLLLNRMGYFNPFAADFIRNVFSYSYHWFKYYAFTRRSLVFAWFIGSLMVIIRSFRLRGKLHKVPPEQTEALNRIARVYDRPLREIEALGQLQRRPITQRFYRLVRELWIDRLFIALMMTVGTIALALVPIPLWIKLMVPLSSFPAAYFIYEWATEGETIFTIEKEIPRRARAVASVLPARVIAFGHTHKPRLIPLTQETTFVDTGTWAPITAGKDKETLAPGRRNYLEISFQRKAVSLDFGSWLPGAAPYEEPPPRKKQHTSPLL